MTLEEIKDGIVAAIGQDDRDLTEARFGNDAQFSLALTLLDTQSIVYTSLLAADVAVTYDDDLDADVLTVSGTATMYTVGASTEVKLFQYREGGTRFCTVTSSLGSWTLNDLKNQSLLSTDNITPLNLLDATFTSVDLDVNTETGLAKFKGTTCSQNALQILAAPAISLSEIGFVLERYRPDDGESNDARLFVSGKFAIGNDDYSVAVQLPIGETDTVGLWRLVYDAAAPGANVALNTIATWVGLQSLFASVPTDVSDLAGLYIKNITVEFDAAGGSLGMISVTVATETAWGLADGVELRSIAVTAELVGPLNSPSLALSINCTFALGTITLDGVLILSTESDEWIASFSTSPDHDRNQKFKLSAVNSLPGTFNTNMLGIPQDGNAEADIALQELTFTISPRSPVKLRSIYVNVTTNITWTVIPDKLVLSNPQLSLELIDPLNQATRRINARLLGTVQFLQVVDLVCEVALVEGVWYLRVETQRAFNLVQALNRLVPLPNGVVDRFAGLNVESIRATYTHGGATRASDLSFSLSVTEAMSLAIADGITITVPRLSLDCSMSKPAAGSWSTPAMSLRGDFRIQEYGFDASLVFTCRSGAWSCGIEFMGMRAVYSGGAQSLLEFTVGERTIGDVLQFVYRLGVPDGRLEFPEPWSLLMGRSLSGLKFTVNLSRSNPALPPTERFGVSLDMVPPADLLLLTLHRISLQYMSNGRFKMAVRYQRLGMAQPVSTDWDPQTQQPPAIGPTRAPLFDLKFLALGQRLRLNDLADVRTVRGVLGTMKNAFADVNPNQHPLAANAGLGYAPERQWLIGADFSLLGFLSLALVFNDGLVAGLSLGLSGERARFFAGLDFEILYKKVTESIGVYQIELRLPDAIRQIELGQVSITIPIIALEIYTNGNFRVDLGFPKNNDFSRSFVLQVFPFIGSGGFYFALLEGATSPRLPAGWNPNRGGFSPVLSFGIGMNIGLGKQINRGIFAAELSLTFEGILEGVLAYFTPVESLAESVMPSWYYWLNGSLGIVGRIRGSVSFAVITAEVSLVLYARVGITLESLQPLVLSFEAGVDIRLTVRVGVGWLAVDINCSFHTQISERFEIPVRAPGVGPWLGADPQPHALPLGDGWPAAVQSKDVGTANSLVIGETAPPATPRPQMSWLPILSQDDQRGNLEVLFRPTFTVATIVEPNSDPTNRTHGVGMLYLKTLRAAQRAESDPNNPVPSSGFELLAEAVTVWCINSLINYGVIVEDRDVVLNDAVTLDQLRAIYRVLTDTVAGAAPFKASEVSAFLGNYFNVEIQALKRPERGIEEFYNSELGRPTVCPFPMIPQLRLESRVHNLGDDDATVVNTLHYAVTFNEHVVTPITYHDEIARHFQALGLQYRTDAERMADSLDLPNQWEASSLGHRAIVDFVFEDYFVLIARGAIDAAIGLMRSEGRDVMCVSEIVTMLRDQGRFIELSGMTSLFTIPGLRLPKPSTLPVDSFGLWIADSTAPLYAMTGQQFLLPEFGQLEQQPFAYTIELVIPPMDGDHIWYSLRYVGDAEPQESRLKIELKGNEMDMLDGLAAALFDPEITQPIMPIVRSISEPRRYALANPVTLTAGTAVTLPVPVNTAATTARMFAFPGALQSIVASAYSPRAFNAEIGIQSVAQGPMTFAPAAPYGWATAVRVRVRKLRRGDNDTVAYAYEIDGADPEGTLQLEQLIRHAGQNRDESFIKAVNICFETPAEVGQPRGLWSDANATINAFVLRTNLSTVTNPESTKRGLMPKGSPENVLNFFDRNRLDELQLLWQASIVRSGGYFLYYFDTIREAGLPDDIFDDSDTAVVTFVIHYEFALNLVPGFVDRLVTADSRAANGSVFAASSESTATVAIAEGTSIQSLVRTTCSPFNVLVDAVKEKSLVAGADIKFEWMSHQVQPMDTWASICSSYAITDIELLAENGWIDLDEAPVHYSVLSIPLRTHLTIGGERLCDIAAGWNVPVAELVHQNALLPALAATTITLTEQLLVKQATVQPGYTGFSIQRAEPEPGIDFENPVDPNDDKQIEYLYSLLVYRSKENAWFEASNEGLPVPPEAVVSIVNPNSYDWKYEKVVPYYRLYDEPVGATVGRLPDPAQNPYRGVGGVFQIGIDWSDGFGNRILSAYSEADAESLALRIGYTDELVCVERWPGVTASYTVAGNGNNPPRLSVSLAFDRKRYLPRGRNGVGSGDVHKLARTDLELYRTVYYQLTYGRTDVVMWNSLNRAEVVVNRQSVLSYVETIIDYVARIADPTHAFTYVTANEGDSAIVVAYVNNLSLEELRLANPGIPDVFPQATQLLIPDFPVGTELDLVFDVAATNTMPIFPLSVRLGIRRYDRVDFEFLDAPGVREVFSEIEPSAAVARDTVDDGESATPGTLRAFAQVFESAYANLKLATGLSRVGDREIDSRNRLWVVQIGPQGLIQHSLEPNDQSFFAPIPLSTTLLSESDMVVFAYSGAANMEEKLTSYTSVDLDAWARTFLDAVDTILLPEYAVPTFVLDHDSGEALSVAGCYDALILAKQQIADAIAATVYGIAEGTEGDIDQARELLRQRMLVRLSTAYTVDAVVQLRLNCVTPFGVSVPDVPKLYGKPQAKQAGPGSGDADENSVTDFTFSTAKIPLTDEYTYLTLLFDSERAMPEARFDVDVSFEATALEYEIAPVPGIDGYMGSSWLTFLIPETVIAKANPVRVRIPVPIRSYPVPPSVTSQWITPGYAGGQVNPPIEVTRQYAYEYTYRRANIGQDLVYTSPRFNVRVNPPGHGINDQDPNLFQALAMFEYAWEEIRKDLISGLPGLQEGYDGRDVVRTRRALSAFTAIVGKVATAWGSWAVDRLEYEEDAGAVGEYQYVISENDDNEDNAWEIAVRVCAGPADAPIPAIAIEGCEATEVDPQHPRERRFRYVVGGGPNWLTASELTDDWQERTVLFDPLDILNKQNAWAGVQLTRNETLFGDNTCVEGAAQRTDPRFVYRTPIVRSTDVLTPLLRCDDPIDAANIDEGGPNRTIYEHVATIMNRIFETVVPPVGETEIRLTQVAVRYHYALNSDVPVGSDTLWITLPIAMAPPFGIVKPDDFTDCPAQSFVCKLAQAIYDWYYERLPSRASGYFVFDISVYSSLGNTGKLPIYRVTDLELSLENVTDLVE